VRLQLLGEALHGALVAAADYGTDQRRGESLAARDSQPGGFEGDPGSPAGKLGQRVGPGRDATARAARQQLLDAAIEYTAEHGISDLSLRSLAAALGTSHRMLIFHFGSKEGLWVEIARTVDRRQREQLRGFPPDPGQPLGEFMRAWWKLFSAPALWPYERTRGLLLDLLATGDTEAADQAMDAFITLTERWLETNTPSLRHHPDTPPSTPKPGTSDPAQSSGTAKKRSATGRALSGASWAVCPYFHSRARHDGWHKRECQNGARRPQPLRAPRGFSPS
jgi:AcrR family transcriptional regulator